MSLPSYYDLMRAFMALRDGEKDHDLEAETGLKPDSPDYQRIVECRRQLESAWTRANEGADEAGSLGEFTVFCCQSSGGGTTWIQAVTANDAAEAATTGRGLCAADWSWDEEDIHVLGVVSGPINVLTWDDIGD